LMNFEFARNDSSRSAIDEQKDDENNSHRFHNFSL
jgi:hypothetical protein